MCVCVCDVTVYVYVYVQEVCYQYWPSSGTQTYGEFTVELVGEENLSGFSLRTFGAFNSKVSHFPTTTEPVTSNNDDIMLDWQVSPSEPVPYHKLGS